MARETIQEFKDELKEIKSLEVDILKLVRSEREERLKNTNDILRLDRQININNGDKCIKTRITETEDDIENIKDEILEAKASYNTLKAVCGLLAVLIGGAFSLWQYFRN
jgi:flagellar basal body rod protein FlgF